MALSTTGLLNPQVRQLEFIYHTPYQRQIADSGRSPLQQKTRMGRSPPVPHPVPPALQMARMRATWPPPPKVLATTQKHPSLHATGQHFGRSIAATRDCDRKCAESTAVPERPRTTTSFATKNQARNAEPAREPKLRTSTYPGAKPKIRPYRWSQTR